MMFESALAEFSFFSPYGTQVVFSVSQQLNYLRHYKIHLRQLVGEKKADEIITNAIFLLSMGTNDFLQNYYVEPTRSSNFTVEEYQHYLISCMDRDIRVFSLFPSIYQHINLQLNIS